MSYSHYVISKWTKGEEVERSLRKKDDSNNSQRQTQQSLLQTDMNEIQTDSGYTRQPNKRDSFNEMLSHRDLHTQVGQNPFLAGEHYLQHLHVQENYLRPQNTNAFEPKGSS